MQSHRVTFSATALLVLVVGGAIAYARSQVPIIESGVKYGARVACACRYVGNRAIGDCYKDFVPGMELIALRDDPATKTVTAYVPVFDSESATFDPIAGCRSQNSAQPGAITRQASR